MSRISHKKEEFIRRSAGFSLVELLIVVAIILTIAAIAVPNLLRARMTSNEAAAISTLRNINSSQVVYYNAFPTTGFAITLAQLGPSVACDAAGACLVDQLVGCAAEPCIKGGYQYFMTSSTSSSTPHLTYAATGTPVRLGQSGTKNICSVEDAVLRQAVTAVATLGSGLTNAVCGDNAQYTAISN